MILLTNDDGVHAPGLVALVEELGKLGKVAVVVPDRPRSACAHSITLHKPLRVHEVVLSNGLTAFITNGTPSDCVAMAVDELLDEKPELVASGINLGPNLGDDVTYSGTVAAAMEGAIYGVKSFAVSISSYEASDFTFAADFSRKFAEDLLRRDIPMPTLFNINIPNLPPDRIAGVALTRQGTRRYVGTVHRRVDPRGRVYFWRDGDLPESPDEEGTDVAAVAAGLVAVTPLQLDMTSPRVLEQMRHWPDAAWRTLGK